MTLKKELGLPGANIYKEHYTQLMCFRVSCRLLYLFHLSFNEIKKLKESMILGL